VANEACPPSPQATSAHAAMHAPMSRIGLAQARLEPVKYDFPERVVVDRRAGVIVPCQHRHAVKPAVHPQAQTRGHRGIKTPVAAVLEPGIEPARLPVIDARFHIRVSSRFQNVATKSAGRLTAKGEPGMAVSSPVAAFSLKPITFPALRFVA